jgi:hypothetical protein
MIFSPITPKDYPKLKEYFKNHPYKLSIYSLPSLIVWSNHLFRVKYTIKGDSLIICAESERQPDDRYLLMPISPVRDYSPEELYQLAKELGFKRYSFIPEDCLNKYNLKEISLMFDLTEQKGFEDYIYQKDALAKLKGNSLIRKRNLIHQFNKTYPEPGRVKIEKITAINTHECLEFLDVWCKNYPCEPNQDENLACEKQATINMLHNIDLFEAKGLLIRIDGTVCAFGICSHLTQDMGVLNFEKAFSHIKGLYQFLDRTCAQQLFKDYQWINKESDLGIHGLRQSKRSYRPAMRVKSFCLDVRQVPL